ncbi:exo-alpha-sialidase [Blastopirellula sp. JC732]|uniref:Exo-alpha-sialidase n=1 Tax=Blastopirellula sediminis TaxID=2894196 RepID=A0A9X1MPC2_9BACT|nr:sialidase family protein [Blastopirellula sediminis]MCC9606803.1 exo-alpha-sialidase [Blastopirellula sediminis]MCC9629900.1 exo-alpha-sialidase [Blastopirellula sediminis]
MTRYGFPLLLLLAASISFAHAEDAETSDRLIAQPGVVSVEYLTEGAPHDSCHASTIAQTKNGLVAAWFGGTREGAKDVGIFFNRQIDGKWGKPVEVANGVQYVTPDGKEYRHPCWNPVLHQVADGDLMLFYKCGPSPSTWWGMLMTSSDGGKAWSEPHRLPEGIDGPVKNKPIVHDGQLVCPSSSENDGWRLHLEMTSDLGRTWTRVGPLNEGHKVGAIQPSVLVHPDGRWQILARDRNGDGNVWSTWSDDQGITWSPLQSSGLPNPNSGTDAVMLADGRALLVYNHTHRTGSFPSGRNMLNVAVSKDGKAWEAALLLEKSPGEYSYPAVIQTPDGLVHITYTWQRKKVRHVTVDPTKLQTKPIVESVWPTSS